METSTQKGEGENFSTDVYRERFWQADETTLEYVAKRMMEQKVKDFLQGVDRQQPNEQQLEILV